jgi:hypothetical protein
MSFPLENARSKSEWASQVLGKENTKVLMFGMNFSLTSLQKAILWKILNGLKLFFPYVSTII